MTIISSAAKKTVTLTHHRFVQPPEALRANDYDAMNQKLFGFLDKLMESYAAGCRASDENRV